ncbi:MAG: hypothetical protein NTY68_04935 [Candidatus Micrarchaeota archaeon]|nr:hypothetical protein [Candidatus Micrarchaeota archaeon]
MVKTNEDRASTHKGKRGMFMTVSVLMLGMIILSLVFLLSEQIIASKVSAAQFGEIDRTTWTYTSIEDGVSRIVSFYINASTQNGSVTIEQPLPFPRRMADKLEAFSQFENSYAEQNVSMNLTNTEKGNFIIQPSGIAVLNAPGSFAITPQNSTESHESLQSYFIDLTFPEGRVREANWTIISNSSNDLVAVHVRAHDPNYAVVLDTYSNVDRHGTSVLSIIDNLNNITQVALIQFHSPAALQIQTGTAIGLKTIVGFNNLVTLETNDTISVQSTVNKTGRVRIA